ncbi:MAG: hypothetical protein J6A29_03465 [Clostridia bacterium]|nr:hypothetical protein [Clostridia bacterium]
MRNTISEWLEKWFDEVEPLEFYRAIFPSGELERKGEYTTGKYTGILVSISDTIDYFTEKKKIYRYNITDDLEAINEVIKTNNFCLCSPLSYAGKKRTAENARMLYAIAVDVDNIAMNRIDKSPIGLINLWARHVEVVGRIPKPTYIVSSGSGVHLYYVLEKPIPLYNNIVRELQQFKRELTNIIWHDTIVEIRSNRDIQQEGIFQGFRVVGSITKYGDRARAFETGGKVSIEYLNSFVSDESKIRIAANITKKKEGSIRLQEAKELYPDWYERRIVRGENRKVWAINRNLYEWWLRKIKEEARVGHRYYCLMMLAIYAQKCSYYDEKKNPNPVSREELEQDCFSLFELMESLTENENNHFTTDDILAALEAFDERWVFYTRDAIEYKSGIIIPKNKRNGQTQAEHLEEARAIRDIRAKRRGIKWDANNGKQSKEHIVKEWRMKNPKGIKAQCIKETGLSKPTVYKHWDS